MKVIKNGNNWVFNTESEMDHAALCEFAARFGDDWIYQGRRRGGMSALGEQVASLWPVQPESDDECETYQLAPARERSSC